MCCLKKCTFILHSNFGTVLSIVYYMDSSRQDILASPQISSPIPPTLQQQSLNITSSSSHLHQIASVNPQVPEQQAFEPVVIASEQNADWPTVPALQLDRYGNEKRSDVSFPQSKTKDQPLQSEIKKWCSQTNEDIYQYSDEDQMLEEQQCSDDSSEDSEIEDYSEDELIPQIFHQIREKDFVSRYEAERRFFEEEDKKIKDLVSDYKIGMTMELHLEKVQLNQNMLDFFNRNYISYLNLKGGRPSKMEQQKQQERKEEGRRKEEEKFEVKKKRVMFSDVINMKAYKEEQEVTVMRQTQEEMQNLNNKQRSPSNKQMFLMPYNQIKISLTSNENQDSIFVLRPINKTQTQQKKQQNDKQQAYDPQQQQSSTETSLFRQKNYQEVNNCDSLTSSQSENEDYPQQSGLQTFQQIFPSIFEDESVPEPIPPSSLEIANL